MHDMMLYYTILRGIILYYIIFYNVISCYITLYYIVSCHIILHIGALYLYYFCRNFLLIDNCFYDFYNL